MTRVHRNWLVNAAFIKELEACSLIEITRRGQGKTNLYTINFVVKKRASKS